MTFNETGSLLDSVYYVQQLFGLFLGCCIVRKKRKYLAFWSRDVLSLTFQAFPFNKSTEWWERGWSKSSSRHVSAVQISHSLKGLTSSNVLDQLWNRDWAYLSNCTLSAAGPEEGCCIRLWNRRKWADVINVFMDQVVIWYKWRWMWVHCKNERENQWLQLHRIIIMCD